MFALIGHHEKLPGGVESPYGVLDHPPRRVSSLDGNAGQVRRQMTDHRLRARAHTGEHGEDPADIRDWSWPR
ncbi:hypothetical protein GCM10009555_032280 [Acrocarpospora macrocephala]|uniref:Xylulose 5-phosphate/Fructose 6-phosphate phosphoketolase C-terminal domain-containing protein n=1 Tax=Acrocarpospora macrocephala TaxID=150177 RepID=A0A5M3WDK0_9ACTN|nr:hypothetical protein Amac_000040 [Acrocarpospora macrocephala]